MEEKTMSLIGTVQRKFFNFESWCYRSTVTFELFHKLLVFLQLFWMAVPVPACGFEARGLCVYVEMKFVTGSRLTWRAVTSHVMDQPHRVMWLPANTTQQELHSDKHNPTWHIHGKIGTKSFLKLSFRGAFIHLQNAPEKAAKQYTGKGSNTVTGLVKQL